MISADRARRGNPPRARHANLTPTDATSGHTRPHATAPHRHATVHTDCATTTPCIIHSLAHASDSHIVSQQTTKPSSSQSGHWLNVQHPSPQGHASQIIFTPCASARILPATESATATAAANSPERAQAPCRLAHASQGRTVTAPTPASSHHRRLHYHHHHLATAPDCTVTARVRHAGWPTR